MTVELKQLPIEERSRGKILEIRVQGKLEKEDYKAFEPEVERLLKQHGKIRILFVMDHFEGWTAGALWEDIGFDFKHFNDIEKLVLVGDKQWEKGMAVFCKPFTTAEVRYFDRGELDQARDWISR